MLSGRGAANLVPPTSSSWGIPGAFQHESFDHEQNTTKECPRTRALKKNSQEQNFSIKKCPACTWRFDKWICWKCLWRIFGHGWWISGSSRTGGCFVFGWRILRWIFSVDFSFVLCIKTSTANTHRKIHHFHGGLLEYLPPVGWNPDRPWANSKFSTETLHEVGMVFLPIFLSRLRNSWSMATAPLEIPRQAGFKPHKQIRQEITHPRARRQAEIYTPKRRMAPQNSLQVWRESG